MERLEEMLNFISEEIEIALNKRKRQFEETDIVQKEEILGLFDNANADIDNKKDGCIVISYLRSSYITGSHKFKISIYNDEPFIEMNAPSYYLSLDVFYKEAAHDMDIFIKKLSQKFICILSSEIEEIRRYYMEKLYQSSIVFFQSVIAELKNNDTQTKVFFGEEMGEIELITVI